MIEKGLSAWLASKKEPAAEEALIVRFDLSPEVLRGAKTRKERIDAVQHHVRRRLGELVDLEKVLPGDSVQTMGALGQAIIRAEAKVLCKLAAPGSALERAKDVHVTANRLVEGVRTFR